MRKRKSICCPKHQTKLEIKESTVTLANNTYRCVIGTCTYCRHAYINSPIFLQHSTRLGFEKSSYRYLKSLEQKYPAKSSFEISTPHESKTINSKYPIAHMYRYNHIPLNCHNCHMSLKKADDISQEIPRGSRYCPQCKSVFIPKTTDLGKVVNGERIYPAARFCMRFPSVPKGAILIAELWQEDIEQSLGWMCIVKNPRHQDPATGRYWVGRQLSALILASLKDGTEEHFVFNNHPLRVIKKQILEDTDKYLKIIGRFSDTENPPIVYLYSQKTTPNITPGDYESVTAMVKCPKNEALIPINVYYEKKTGKYFLNEVTYRELLTKYGFPNMQPRLLRSSSNSFGFENLNEHSELNLFGYNVKESNGLSDSERHNLLALIIDSNFIPKYKIINHLEALIKLNEYRPNMRLAVKKWKHDLRFVNAYQMDKQRSIFAKKIVDQRR